MSDISWDHPAPFTLSFQVSADDIDGLNHTNNQVYVKWCEQAAWAHSVALGLDLASYRRLDRAMIITRSEFDYLAASGLGDEVTAATWIVNWDRKLTMTRDVQVVRNRDQVTLLRSRITFVCVELSSGRPRRLPAEFIEGYGGVAVDSAQ